MTDANSCIHLTVENILEIHQSAIDNFGGAPGIKDVAAVESALAAAQATFGGECVFSDVVEIATAYLFYLSGNHPFVDGNKRVALGACLVFLRWNGFRPKPDCEDWERLTMSVAASECSRESATEILRGLVD
jgi:death-on-curing protein